MFEKEEIEALANKYLPNGNLFVVEVKILPGNEIEVYIDSDERVSVDECIAVSRAMDAEMEQQSDDYALTVSSAGIGQPLRAIRQYKKLIGRSVEVLLTGGVKILGVLESADDEGFSVSYPEKRTVEGRKRPETVDVSRRLAYGEVKTAREHLDFK